MLTAIWLLTHRYQGLIQDARLYAVQALAELHPEFKSDLFLQNGSQDRYSVFSPAYAQVIRLLGLRDAARLLTILFKIWFLAAAWSLIRELLGRDAAWLAVGALILTAGTYGSYRVFSFSEDYLTARLPAEALIATALAVYLRGRRWLASAVATGAVFVHPLMALPGLLLLIFLSVPTRAAVGLASAGAASVLAIALAATTVPAARLIFPVLDAAWLDIVRERSQFLFLQLWTFRDWEMNLRPFASLVLSALVFTDPRTRKLFLATAIVGISGLAVAGVASTLGPVALLMQGQAWRWVWITAFISALLMLPTAMRLWRGETIGPLCAILLVASWTLPEVDAPLLVVFALALFQVRTRIAGVAKYMGWAGLALGLAVLLWAVTHVSSALSSMSSAGSEATLLHRAGVPELRLCLMVSLLVAWIYIRHARSVWIPVGVCIVLLTACAKLAPATLNKIDVAGSASEIVEFADWRQAIPPDSNVYVANGRDASSFAWFTLGRPSYLSLDQSAGVIFSRATALEVQRRSQVLLPIMDEDWKLLSKNRAVRSAGTQAPRRTPLTAKSLVSMCKDPTLEFLVAKENVGFEPVTHRQAGVWKDWNLYDCARVRRSMTAV